MQEKANRALLREQLGKDNVTQDGRKIHIVANIGSTADIPDALENDAGGIGLFRSEFLYLESSFFRQNKNNLKHIRPLHNPWKAKSGHSYNGHGR